VIGEMVIDAAEVYGFNLSSKRLIDKHVVELLPLTPEDKRIALCRRYQFGNIDQVGIYQVAPGRACSRVIRFATDDTGDIDMLVARGERIEIPEYQ